MDTVTIRRTIQQAGHCIAEALAVVTEKEHCQHAVNDLEQSKSLIEIALKDLQKLKEDDGPY